MNILIASSVHEPTLRAIRQSHDVVEAVDASHDVLARLIADRHVVVFRSGVQMTAELMAQAPELRLLIRAGSGLDNLDVDYVREHEIELVRIPGPGARAVAELTFAFMLVLSRQVMRADALFRKGHWAKHEITGHLLAGKTLGVYGSGNIGRQVGRMGSVWGMEVLGCVEYPSNQRARDLAGDGIRLVTPDELLTRSDIVSLHVPLHDSTRLLIDTHALAAMRPGALLVVMARGGVVDERALCAALESGHIAGAGLDVHEKEGEGVISPLAGFENVVLTPHMGAGTVDTRRLIGERILDILAERSG